MRGFYTEGNSLPIPVGGEPFYVASSRPTNSRISMTAVAAACLSVFSPTSAGVALHDSHVQILDLRRDFELEKNSVGLAEIRVLETNWVERVGLSDLFSESIDRINDLSGRPDGWKGEGSVAPTREATLDARALIRRLAAEGAERAPMIGAEEDGALIFFWKHGDLLLSISLDGGGHYSYFSSTDGSTHFGDDVRISEPLPRPIRAALARIGSI